jgi:UDP-sulfoquinovose synthase
MEILICGVDGYIGFPLAQKFVNMGFNVVGIDSFLRRDMVSEVGSISAIPIKGMAQRQSELSKQFSGSFNFIVCDIARDYEMIAKIIRDAQPDVIVNLAQQPSAPYSMISPKHANFSQNNNNNGILNLLWAMKEYSPDTPMVTLGTMGEYGLPDVDIPEGYFEVTYRRRKRTLPFPRQGGSFYHVSKVQATDNVVFACQSWGLKVTDIMQGVVYGTRTKTMGEHNNQALQTRFDFDECFGTMINRAVTCAIIGEPITLFGSGKQTRGYIALEDSIQCLTLAAMQSPTDEDSVKGHRVVNQWDELYSCEQIAKEVSKIGSKKFGLDIQPINIENPRVETEKHYYNPDHQKIYDLGFKQTQKFNETVIDMFADLLTQKKRISDYKHKIMPKIKWK